MDAYTKDDVITFEDFEGKWVLTDFADETVAQLAAPNEIGNLTTGYNGNSLGAHNEPGRQRQLTIRIVKGSGDDKRVNRLFNMWQDRTNGWEPLKASFTKLIGHSMGNTTKDTTDCFFGIPGTPPDKVKNVAGDTGQLVSQYIINFGSSKRSL